MVPISNSKVYIDFASYDSERCIVCYFIAAQFELLLLVILELAQLAP